MKIEVKIKEPLVKVICVCTARRERKEILQKRSASSKMFYKILLFINLKETMKNIAGFKITI
jgi:hypothetical protein